MADLTAIFYLSPLSFFYPSAAICETAYETICRLFQASAGLLMPRRLMFKQAVSRTSRRSAVLLDMTGQSANAVSFNDHTMSYDELIIKRMIYVPLTSLHLS